jgi:hypothetical protein
MMIVIIKKNKRTLLYYLRLVVRTNLEVTGSWPGPWMITARHPGRHIIYRVEIPQ